MDVQNHQKGEGIGLSLRVKTILERINQDECPHVPNPPGCKKRASVALVIRIKPPFPQLALYDQKQCSSKTNSFQESLDHFFSQDWVRQGDPEVLFIKRAARTGDRWTSHIAFPGGKRDPDDPKDRATSVRETKEETGLELDVDHCLYIGNLPERVVRTAWDMTPLLVLCPFVYLTTRHDLPPLALQPSEIHSVHWVPIRALLSPALRRNVHCDASDRFTRQRQPYIRLLIRAVAGQMLFGGVKLKPTESLYCSFLPGYIPEYDHSSFTDSVAKVLRSGSFRDHADADDQPLILWGLTLSVVADVLELIDFDGASKLWTWPTFTPWDMRMIIWLMTYRYRSRKLQELGTTTTTTGSGNSPADTVSGMDNIAYMTSTIPKARTSEAGVAALQLLEGYSSQLQRALIVAICLRMAIGTSLATFFIRKYRRSRL